MPVFLKNGHAVLHIHIPKCGGSSFQKKARLDGWKEHFSIHGVHGSEMSWCRISPQHLHAEMLGEFFELDKFNLIIAVVRNPYNRLMSEYFWQKSQCLTRLAPSDWVTSTFDLFQNDPSIFDNHIRPQSDFITPNAKLFRLEDNGVDFALKAMKSLDPFMGSIDSIRNRFMLSLSNTQLKKSRYSLEVESEFARMEGEIRSFYKNDFTRFDYE